jgi:hypothetical protein
MALGIFIACGFTAFIFPLLDQARFGKEASRQLARIKRDPGLFQLMMTTQEMMMSEVGELGLLLGKRAARHTLIKVCNPFCKHCAAGHASIRNLLNEGADIKIRVIFTGEHDPGPVKLFLELAEQANTRLLDIAMDSWYADRKKYKDLVEQYDQNHPSLDRQDKNVEAMRTWCHQMGIKATPTYFLDGRKLPGLYAINDLKWLFLRGNIQ